MKKQFPKVKESHILNPSVYWDRDKEVYVCMFNSSQANNKYFDWDGNQVEFPTYVKYIKSPSDLNNRELLAIIGQLATIIKKIQNQISELQQIIE